MFIERQPLHSYENNPKRSWRSREETSATKYCLEQQQMLFYQPLQYNFFHQYRYNKTPQNYSSFNMYGSKNPDCCGNINSVIPTPSIEYVPMISNKPIQEHHMKNRPLSSGISKRDNIKGYKTRTNIKSNVKDKDTLPTYEAISPNISTEIYLEKPK